MIESGKVIFKANQDFPHPTLECNECANMQASFLNHSSIQVPQGRDGNYTPSTQKHEAKNRQCASESYRNTTSKLNKAIHLESILKISKAGRSKFIKNEQIDRIEHVIISSSFASVEITFFFPLRMSISWSSCQTNKSIVLSMCRLSTNEIDKGGRSIQT